MRKLIFILVVGVLGVTLYSCSPSELDEVTPVNTTVGEDGNEGEEEDGTTVGEDGNEGEEEDGSGN